jgi:hypothetical protein
MSDNTPESICTLASGDERAAYNAFGKRFQIESCGLFANCDHLVEKYDFSSGNEVHVEVYYCSVDYAKVAGAIVMFFVLLFIAWKLYKRARGQQHMQ